MARRSALQDLTNIVNPQASQVKKLSLANHLPRQAKATGAPLAAAVIGEPVLSPPTDDRFYKYSLSRVIKKATCIINMPLFLTQKNNINIYIYIYIHI